MRDRLNINGVPPVGRDAGCTGTTLVELVVAIAIMAVVVGTVLPLFASMRTTWDTSQNTAEVLQNGRVLMDHLHRHLVSAAQVTAVSDADQTGGYLQFKDNNDTTLRYEIGTDDYVAFGEVGSLAPLAGPVSQLQFTCYEANDFSTPTTDGNDIRFVEVQSTVVNAAERGQDLTFNTAAYLRANSCHQEITYLGFSEAKKLHNGPPLVIPKPTGTREGDILIAAVSVDGNVEPQLTPPAGQGWTRVSCEHQTGKVTLGVWWKAAGASEPSSYQWTWGGGREEAYAWIMRVAGPDVDAPIHAWAAAAGKSTTPTCPSLTTTATNCIILRVGAFDQGDVFIDSPGLAGHTAITMDESTTTRDACSGGGGYVVQAQPGACGAVTFTLTDKEEYRTLTLALAEAVLP